MLTGHFGKICAGAQGKRTKMYLNARTQKCDISPQNHKKMLNKMYTNIE